VWSIARYEFTIQRRSLAFWLVAIILAVFMYGEVLQDISNEAGLASGLNPFLVSVYGTEAQETMNVTSFSIFQAWGISDVLGLMSALLLGILSAFVWQRDRRLGVMDMLSARPFQSWHYVLGKYMGVIFSWAAIVTPLVIIGIVWTYVEAGRYGLTVALADFPMPLIGWMLLSLAYSTAFIMMVSLIVRNGVGTLLIYFIYWGYCVMDVRMLRGASTAKLFSYWLIRSGYSITLDNFYIVQSRFSELLLNRLLYLLLTILLVCLTVWVFNRFRKQGTLIGIGGNAD